MTAREQTASVEPRERTSYDEVPYESNPFAQTHPEHLATLATLFGMDPPAVAGARLLELGCASGGNLVPLAVTYPGAKLLGIDLSSRQINAGRALVEALGIDNIELRHASITDVDEAEGEFDYIICHGVYSWVPDRVQRHIMRLCARNLSRNGVAYISYNTYPGWHLRGMVRDMMRYHTRQFPDPNSQVAQARALLDFLSSNAPQAQNNAYGTLLKSELDLLSRQRDSYLFHEHLEEVNDPIYFHEFAERAAGENLQYLAEADFSTMLASNFPREVEQTLRKVGSDIIRMEQYMDFLRNRQFRQTLLVHKDIILKRNLGPEDVSRFYVSSPAEKVEVEDKKVSIKSSEPQQFTTEAGTSLTTARPLFKAAMSILVKNAPASIPFDVLLEKSLRTITGEDSNDDVKRQAGLTLGQDLLQAFSARLVEFRTTAAPFLPKPDAKPRATPLVRKQAQTGRVITSLKHQNVTVDDFGRHLLALLNGERDSQELVKALTQQVLAGVLNMHRNGQPLTERAEVEKVLAENVPTMLGQLAKKALLQA